MLDIETPKGQETLKQEARAAAIMQSHWPNCLYAHTNKEKPCVVDAVMIKDGVVAAVVEMKCRPTMTLDLLRSSYGNRWLITFEKIRRGEAIARELCVPYWGLLYLVPDDVVLRVKIFDPVAGRIADYWVDRTRTQKTVNGGSAVRVNAYVDMSTCDVIREKPRGDQ